MKHVIAKGIAAGVVIEKGVATGKLKRGLKIDGVAQKDFEMREHTTEDILNAEESTPVGRPLAFSTELITLQLVRVGDFTGPFTMGMMKKLHSSDWKLLRIVQEELERLGEADSIGGETA